MRKQLWGFMTKHEGTEQTEIWTRVCESQPWSLQPVFSQANTRFIPGKACLLADWLNQVCWECFKTCRAWGPLRPGLCF